MSDAVSWGVGTAIDDNQTVQDTRKRAAMTLRFTAAHRGCDLLAERNSRVDDLALLVDLISSGWRGVDQRLARIEAALEQRGGAVVYRIERPELQTG